MHSTKTSYCKSRVVTLILNQRITKFQCAGFSVMGVIGKKL